MSNPIPMTAVTGHWTPVASVVLKDHTLSLQARGLYALICTFTRPLDGKMHMWAGRERLAKEAGMSVTSITRLGRELTKRGLIIKKRQLGTSSLTFLGDLSAVYGDSVAFCSDVPPVGDTNQPPVAREVHEVEIDVGGSDEKPSSQPSPKKPVKTAKVPVYKSPDFTAKAEALNDSWRDLGREYVELVCSEELTDRQYKGLYYGCIAVKKAHGYDPLERLDDLQKGLRAHLDGLSDRFRTPKPISWLWRKDGNGEYQMAMMIHRGSMVQPALKDLPWGEMPPDEEDDDKWVDAPEGR